MAAGILARDALIGAVYKRGVNLTGAARTTITNATLMNHLSTDISRVDACAQWFVRTSLYGPYPCLPFGNHDVDIDPPVAARSVDRTNSGYCLFDYPPRPGMIYVFSAASSHCC